MSMNRTRRFHIILAYCALASSHVEPSPPSKLPRDEFKRHRGCTKSEADVFLSEWTSYAITLAKQLSKRTAFPSFGVDIKEEQLDDFKAEQVVQLYELFQEATKPPTAEDA